PLLVLGTGCLVMGGITFYSGRDNDLIAKLFGGFFMFIGGLLWIQVPFALAKVLNKKESLAFEADRTGIRIAPAINMDPISYRWRDIDRIVLAKRRTIKKAKDTPLKSFRDIKEGKGFDTEYSGKSSDGYAENVIMIFFKPTLHQNLSSIERSNLQVWRAPEGQQYSILSCPKHSLPDIQKKLSEITYDPPEVILCRSVKFDYTVGKERITLSQ
ncbi:MAG: hypothetical protein D3909_05960, partial [Candidatus Electrothrix sp. ATG1]|nr:hypothetical protein [Candidatus Electrothrix sp. ATG1]